MSIQNDEIMEEILHQAHKLGIYKEVMELASDLIKKEVEMYTAYSRAFEEIKKQNDIH